MQKWMEWGDAFSERLGQLCGVLTLLMMILAVVVVGLRYGFGIGSIALQETVLYLHGAAVTLGAAYTLKQQGHVRVDIFYRRFSKRRKAWVDLVGLLGFVLPSVVVIVTLSWNYVLNSWSRWEGSAEAGGLPLVYLHKTLLLALALTLGLQALVELGRNWRTIRTNKVPEGAQ
ncbi:TRAP transporter small permease subunit [Ferrimonas aestuarii]|nr:TRAP transporter small permease subunit [Ferrimonas aestuarii]